MAKHVQQDGVPNAVVVDARKALARKFAAHAHSEGEIATSVNGLVLFRHNSPSACYPAMCEPSLSIFGQGRKLISMSRFKVRYSKPRKRFPLSPCVSGSMCRQCRRF